MQSCCSPIASASAAAPRLHRSASTDAPCLRPLQLLLSDCVHFSCCLPLASASTALPDCVHFNCCSTIASPCDSTPRPSHFRHTQTHTYIDTQRAINIYTCTNIPRSYSLASFPGFCPDLSRSRGKKSGGGLGTWLAIHYSAFN